MTEGPFPTQRSSTAQSPVSPHCRRFLPHVPSPRSGPSFSLLPLPPSPGVFAGEGCLGGDQVVRGLRAPHKVYVWGCSTVGGGVGSDGHDNPSGSCGDYSARPPRVGIQVDTRSRPRGPRLRKGRTGPATVFPAQTRLPLWRWRDHPGRPDSRVCPEPLPLPSQDVGTLGTEGRVSGVGAGTGRTSFPPTAGGSRLRWGD